MRSDSNYSVSFDMDIWDQGNIKVMHIFNGLNLEKCRPIYHNPMVTDRKWEPLVPWPSFNCNWQHNKLFCNPGLEE